MILCLGIIVLIVFGVRHVLKNFQKSKKRNIYITSIIVIGLIILRILSGPAIESIEAVEPAKTGFLGGLGLPIVFSWIVGAFFAAGLAYVIGKIALGLRADYLAIATLLISEIVIAVIKHEDWLARGVKNVIGLKRPVPYEVNLQSEPWFIDLVAKWNHGA
jgi:branched-chain amino acid transport system permease protein